MAVDMSTHSFLEHGSYVREGIRPDTMMAYYARLLEACAHNQNGPWPSLNSFLTLTQMAPFGEVYGVPPLSNVAWEAAIAHYVADFGAEEAAMWTAEYETSDASAGIADLSKLGKAVVIQTEGCTLRNGPDIDTSPKCGCLAQDEGGTLCRLSHRPPFAVATFVLPPFVLLVTSQLPSVSHLAISSDFSSQWFSSTGWCTFLGTIPKAPLASNACTLCGCRCPLSRTALERAR